MADTLNGTTGAAQSFTVATGTDIFTASGHGLSDGDEVFVTTTGTLPAPLAVDTIYYVRDATTNTFKLAETSGGTAINITTTGSGTNSVQERADDLRVLTWDTGGNGQFILSFNIASGSLTTGNKYLARHGWALEIDAMSVSAKTPVTTPGSGGDPALFQLKKTGTADDTPGADLLGGQISLVLGDYWQTRDESGAPIAIAAGEGLYCAVDDAGNIAPVNVDVHLLCRKV